jgi:hypothetical protein
MASISWDVLSRRSSFRRLNIAIPYRLVHQGIELKFALRSIQKHLKGYRDVYLVGDKFPKWYKGKTIYCPEETIKSSVNILNKLIKAGELREVGETFLQWQDDIFLQEPLHVKDIKYWFDGTLEQAAEKSLGRYSLITYSTGLKLGGSALYYDIHTPIIYDIKTLKTIKSEFRKQLLVKSMYCHRKGVTGTPLKDCKLNEPYENVREAIQGKLFFSIGPGVDPNIIEVLEELYPEKSIYE